ncbi:Uncharacterised protein [Brucella abortus]|nr:Uncharacterised protein [Brucella abortus]
MKKAGRGPPFSLHGFSKPACQILNILPRNTARTVAACGGPFQGFPVHLVAGIVEFEMRRIAVDHGKIIVLAAFMKAEPQAEAVRQ